MSSQSLPYSARGIGHSVVSFKGVSFGHSDTAGYLLDKVDFSIRQGSKVTIMGQNGSGKSTIIKLLCKKLRPDQGQVIVGAGETVACALQTMPQDYRDLTVRAFFAKQFGSLMIADHELLAKISKVLNSVRLEAPVDRIVKSFSGGQQARLLLAAALILDPSILLLDEPTNNLDHEGLERLQALIQETDKTCVVISHDESFLNAFTDNVLYLDVHSRKVEAYPGDYFLVKEEIAKRIKRENATNAQLNKAAQAKKDQANKFANKGGGMRKVAKTMRTVAAKMEASLVEVRKEDIALEEFDIPFSPSSLAGTVMSIGEVTSFQRSAKIREGPIELTKGSRIQVCGPNGIGA